MPILQIQKQVQTLRVVVSQLAGGIQLFLQGIS